MKIAFVFDDSIDRPDGVQQAILTFGKWLTSSGHEVHYICGQSERSDVNNVHSLARNLKVRFNRNSLSIPIYANKRRIKELLAREEFDVLHIQMPYSPVMAGKVIKSAPAGTAIVGTFHILPFGLIERIGARLLMLGTSSSRKLIDKNISVSKPAAVFAKRSLGIESEVIPNPVDLSKFRNAPIDPNKDLFRIVYLNRLVKRKGAMELIDAIGTLPNEQMEKIEVIIAGKGPLLKRLKAKSERTDIEHLVYFPGFVDEEKKSSLLRSADLAVFPSLGGESFGIVLVEAIASGAGAVIGGNNPGYSSVLGDNPKTIFNPKDVAEFSALLIDLIDNHELRDQIHISQKKSLMQYDVNIVGKKLVDFYDRAIEYHKTMYN